MPHITAVPAAPSRTPPDNGLLLGIRPMRRRTSSSLPDRRYSFFNFGHFSPSPSNTPAPSSPPSHDPSPTFPTPLTAPLADYSGHRSARTPHRPSPCSYPTTPTSGNGPTGRLTTTSPSRTLGGNPATDTNHQAELDTRKCRHHTGRDGRRTVGAVPTLRQAGDGNVVPRV